jgi:hypothetical protein
MDGTMQRERASVLPLIVFPSRQFLQPQERHDERFSISSNRVRPPSGGATQNEDKPDPCEVKHQQGTRNKEMLGESYCNNCERTYGGHGKTCPHCGSTNTQAKAFDIETPIVWLLKLPFKIAKLLCKIIFNKWIFSILTLGIGVLLYKGFKKIYED